MPRERSAHRLDALRELAHGLLAGDRLLEPDHLDLLERQPGRGDPAVEERPVGVGRLVHAEGVRAPLRRVDEDHAPGVASAPIALALEAGPLLVGVRHADRDDADPAVGARRAVGRARHHLARAARAIEEMRSRRLVGAARVEAGLARAEVGDHELGQRHEAGLAGHGGSRHEQQRCEQQPSLQGPHAGAPFSPVAVFAVEPAACRLPAANIVPCGTAVRCRHARNARNARNARPRRDRARTAPPPPPRAAGEWAAEMALV